MTNTTTARMTKTRRSRRSGRAFAVFIAVCGLLVAFCLVMASRAGVQQGRAVERCEAAVTATWYGTELNRPETGPECADLSDDAVAGIVARVAVHEQRARAAGKR